MWPSATSPVTLTDLLGVQRGHLDGDIGAGLPFNADIFAVDILRIHRVPRQRTGTHRVDVGEIHLDSDVVFLKTGNHRAGAADGQIQCRVRPLGQHQPLGGQRVIRADKFNGEVRQGLGRRIALPGVHIQPEDNCQQQRKH